MSDGKQQESPGSAENSGGSPTAPGAEDSLAGALQESAELRAENRALRNELEEVLANAAENEKIWRHFAAVERILFRTRELDRLAEELLREIKVRFQAGVLVLCISHPEVRERMFDGIPEESFSIDAGTFVVPIEGDSARALFGPALKPVLFSASEGGLPESLTEFWQLASGFASSPSDSKNIRTGGAPVRLACLAPVKPDEDTKSCAPPAAGPGGPDGPGDVVEDEGELTTAAPDEPTDKAGVAEGEAGFPPKSAAGMTFPAPRSASLEPCDVDAGTGDADLKVDGAHVEPNGALEPDDTDMEPGYADVKSGNADVKPGNSDVGTDDARLLSDAGASSEPYAYPAVQSGALIPLNIGELIFGALMLGSPDPGRYHPDDGTDLLERLGANIALSLDNCLTYEKVRDFAVQDQLTGLFNFFQIYSILEREFRRARRTRSPLCVLIVDFNFVQDRDDVEGSKEILRHAAGLLDRILPRDDCFIGRYGSDEFLAVLPNVPEAEAREVIPYLTAAIRKTPFKSGNTAILITTAIGVGSITPQMTCAQDLVDTAYAELCATRGMPAWNRGPS